MRQRILPCFAVSRDELKSRLVWVGLPHETRFVLKGLCSELGLRFVWQLDPLQTRFLLTQASSELGFRLLWQPEPRIRLL